jgi:hypothetical protein
MFRVRHLVVAALAGGLVAAAVPAAAAQIGEALGLGEVNTVDARTVLRGDAGSQPNMSIRNTGGGSPLFLQTLGNGSPPLIVDSDRQVNNLNGDLLDDRHAGELVRAAYAATPDAVNGNGDVVTATITAPTPGMLIMGGGLDAFGTSFETYWCSLEVDGTQVEGSLRIVGVDSSGTTNNAHEDCATDGGVVVVAGTHDVALHIANHNSAEFFDASVWVMWVAFDGEGEVAVP